MAMRTRERASGQTHQSERAHLHASAAQTSSEVIRADRFTAVEILPSNFQGPWERYLQLPPETDGSKQSVSDPSAPNPFEINSTDGMTDRGLFFVKTGSKDCLSCVPLLSSAVGEPECSGSKTSATDPLHPNSNEINGCSGVAKRAAFFVRKSKVNTSFRECIDPEKDPVWTSARPGR